MELLTSFIDIVLHLDKHLAILIQSYGPWIYAILFAIIFAETGLVVFPFLPGDSLLFVAGALAAVGGMDLSILIVVLVLAAILGNSANYAIGRWAGIAFFERWGLLNRGALTKTQAFYTLHGGKTLVISRFLPLLRTFAPFVAGISHMSVTRFTLYNAIGALAWVTSLCLAGYWFGNWPLIKNNLSLVIISIVAISLLPAAIGYLQHRRQARSSP